MLDRVLWAPEVKNPVLPHGASSIEKAVWACDISASKSLCPFIPALPGGGILAFSRKASFEEVRGNANSVEKSERNRDVCSNEGDRGSYGS
jgi:hypothetical protein